MTLYGIKSQCFPHKRGEPERQQIEIPIIRVFPRRTKWTPTDSLSVVGDPKWFLPQLPVKISITFSWDIKEGKRLYRAWKNLFHDVQLGGPAFGDPGGEFAPGLFIKNGVTITSRGCVFNCPWCFVPSREGKLRELKIKPGHIIQDNNFLACSKCHQEKVFEMLQTQNNIEFSGGLDGSLLSTWHVEWFKKLKIKHFWFACDREQDIQRLEKVQDLMSDFPEKKKRCYVMIGFNSESILNAEKRLEKVYSMGFLPFCQLYQGDIFKIYPKEWKELARKWSRPAAYRKKKGSFW